MIITLAMFAFLMVEPSTIRKATMNQQPRVMNSASPTFRTVGMPQRMNGQVELELDVDATGRLRNVRMMRGRADLMQTAIETVRNWRFQAAMHSGQPVRQKFNVVLDLRFANQR